MTCQRLDDVSNYFYLPHSPSRKRTPTRLTLDTEADEVVLREWPERRIVRALRGDAGRAALRKVRAGGAEAH